MCRPGIWLLGICAVLSYQPDSNAQSEGQQEIIEPFMTLELAIRTDDLPEEYRLQAVRDLFVNGAGDIIAIGAEHIAVFDRQGHPKMILSDSGGSPIELENYSYAGAISAAEYLTVIDSGDQRIEYLFSPELHLIQADSPDYRRDYRKILEEKNLVYNGRPHSIFAYKENERVFALFARDPRREPWSEDDYNWDVLIYKNNREFRIIQAHTQGKHIRTGEYQGLQIGSFGLLLLQSLPDRRIVYTHTAHDRVLTDDQAVFTLHVVSLDSLTDVQISHPYEPIPHSVNEMLRNYARIGGVQFDPEAPQNRQRFQPFYQAVEAYPYKAPLSDLMTDGDYIFAFTFTRNDSLGCLTHVFDAEDLRHLRSVYFPTPSSEGLWLRQIRDGCAYTIRNRRGRDGPPVIERYRINPAVYKK